MAKHTRRTTVNIPICLAAVLLCLTMFSFHLSSGVYARYTATASGSDSARVIQFSNITLTKYGNNTQYIAPGVDLEWNADITFPGSEAATYLFMEVTPSSAFTVSADGSTYSLITDGMTWAEWTVNTAGNPAWFFLKEDNGTYVYYVAAAANKPLPPNTALNKKVLFTSNTSEVHPSMTAEHLDLITAPIDADFRASVIQYDSDTFTTAAEAWNKLHTDHPYT